MHIYTTTRKHTPQTHRQHLDSNFSEVLNMLLRRMTVCGGEGSYLLSRQRLPSACAGRVHNGSSFRALVDGHYTRRPEEQDLKHACGWEEGRETHIVIVRVRWDSSSTQQGFLSFPGREATHTHTHTHTRTQTHKRTHAQTHTRAHTHTIHAPLHVQALLRNETCNSRHPMHLCRPAVPCSTGLR